MDQGWKEVEWTVCQGHWQELPNLDPEVDLSAVQLVGPHTNKKEMQSLYLKVYKQWRLLGSPPGEQELMEEVVSSFDDHQGWKQRRAPETAARSWPKDTQPPRNQTPERGRRESSVERSLANVREAHQIALAMAPALEEEIEWLSCPIARSQPEWRTHSRSRYCWIHGSRGQKRRHHQMQSESCLAPYFKYHPSRRNLESSREAMATEDLDLEEPLELGPEVACFLRGLAEKSEEEEMSESLYSSFLWHFMFELSQIGWLATSSKVETVLVKFNSAQYWNISYQNVLVQWPRQVAISFLFKFPANMCSIGKCRFDLIHSTQKQLKLQNIRGIHASLRLLFWTLISIILQPPSLYSWFIIVLLILSLLLFQINLYILSLTLFIKFRLGVGSMDNWYISVDMAIDLTINTWPSVDSPLRFHIFRHFVILFNLSG